MKWKIVAVGLALALITGSALAQNNSSGDETETWNDSNITDGETQVESDASVETVIFASSESHLDGTIVDTASEKLGIPVVLTDPGNLSASTEDDMTALGVERAVVIGGPAAISENVEDDIDNLTVEETERVFGQTASETSVEVADYFWPEGYNETSIVQSKLMQEKDETYRLLSAVMNTAEENPVLLADSNESAEEVMSEIKSENPSQVTSYSLDNTTNNSLEQGLTDVNISSDFNHGNVENLTTDLYSEIQDPEDRELHALVGQSFSFGIPTYAHPNSATYTVISNNVNESVAYIQNSDFETVTAIGQEEIGEELITGLNETGIETSFIRGDNPTEVSVEILSNTSEEWSTKRNETLIQEVFGMTDTDDQPDNETTENTTEEQVSIESNLELNSTNETVTAEATYSSSQQYSKIQNVETTDSEITFTFELVEPEELNKTEQEEYEYSFTEEVEPDTGTYETSTELIVDGETVETVTGTAQIQ